MFIDFDGLFINVDSVAFIGKVDLCGFNISTTGNLLRISCDSDEDARAKRKKLISLLKQSCNVRNVKE